MRNYCSIICVWFLYSLHVQLFLCSAENHSPPPMGQRWDSPTGDWTWEMMATSKRTVQATKSKKTKHVGLQIHMLRWWFFSYVPSRHSEHCLIAASTSAGVRPAMSSVRNTHCWWGDARKNNFFVHFGRRDDLNVNYHKHSGGCLSYPCCLEDSIAIHVFWKIVQLSNPTPKSQNLGSCFLKEKNGPIFSQISFVN